VNATDFAFAWLPLSGYGEGMTVEAIKDEISHLSERERKLLFDWFLEEADIAAEGTKSLSEGLAQAKARRETAVQRMMDFSRTHSAKLPPGETVVGLIREIREGRLKE